MLNCWQSVFMCAPEETGHTGCLQYLLVWLLISGHTHVQSTLKIYEGETHTSPLVENPMRGGTDKLMDDILSMVKGEEVITVQYSLCPGFLVTLAAWVCPF